MAVMCWVFLKTLFLVPFCWEMYLWWDLSPDLSPIRSIFVFFLFMFVTLEVFGGFIGKPEGSDQQRFRKSLPVQKVSELKTCLTCWWPPAGGDRSLHDWIRRPFFTVYPSVPAVKAEQAVCVSVWVLLLSAVTWGYTLPVPVSVNIPLLATSDLKAPICQRRWKLLDRQQRKTSAVSLTLPLAASAAAQEPPAAAQDPPAAAGTTRQEVDRLSEVWYVHPRHFSSLNQHLQAFPHCTGEMKEEVLCQKLTEV